MALIQKAFSDIITFSRSSNATRIGPNGLVQYAPHNLFLQSQTFQTTWLNYQSSEQTDVTAAPDGTITADKLIPDTANLTHSLYQAVTTAALSHTFSIYAKKAGYDFLILRTPVSSNRTWFNLNTGAVGTTQTNATATITSVGNGWYRCSVTVTLTAASNTFEIECSNADNVSQFIGDGTSGIFIWGAQLNVGPLALDYTPTTTAAVYGPRFDYDGSGVTSVDPIARNLVLYSEQFDNASWNKFNGSVTANAATAPDGTVTADLFVPTATNAFHLITGNGVSVTTAAHSIFLKAGGYSKVALRESSSQGSYISVDLSNGTILQAANVGSGTVSNATITAVGNGWYRVSGYFTTPDNMAVGIAVLPDSYTTGSPMTAWTANGTSGVYIWGAQIELGSTATGYMVSGATNGFRAVPVVSGSATARGLLVEEQRTNLLTYSEDFTNWSVTGTASIVANSTTSPDGTVTADAFTSGSTIASELRQSSLSIGSGASTFSVFAKKNTVDYIMLDVTDTTNYGRAWFNVNTGVVGSSAVGGTGISVTSTSIQALGNGWYRCILTVTLTSSTATGRVRFISSTTDNAFTGTASNSVYVWGAQLE